VMAAFTVVHGGLYGKPVRTLRTNRPPYRYETNRFNVTFVHFRWSPTGNLFGCVMPLRDAIERGFVAAPRVHLTVAVSNGVRG